MSLEVFFALTKIRRSESSRQRRGRMPAFKRTQEKRRVTRAVNAPILNPVSYTHLTLPTKRIV